MTRPVPAALWALGAGGWALLVGIVAMETRTTLRMRAQRRDDTDPATSEFRSE